MPDPIAYTECRTLYGEIKRIPTDQLRIRPGAYGLVLHDNRLLLVRGRHTGLYALPGGGIEVGERMKTALKREIQEEAGIAIEVKQFLDFQENFFYYDPNGHAFHGLLFYFWCVPLSLDLATDDQVADKDVEKPRWIPIGDLTANRFQSNGDFTMQLLATVQALRDQDLFAGGVPGVS